MIDFDIFTNEINLTKPSYKIILKQLVYNAPSTPNTINYQSGRKLLAEECLADNDEAQCTFHFSEAVSASIRTIATYRDEQREVAANTLKISAHFSKAEQDLIDAYPISEQDKKVLDLLLNGADEMMMITDSLKKCQIDEETQLHRRYLKFTKEDNIDNFHKILKELPTEWSVVQLTAPYSPSENFKRLTEYQSEIDSIYLSVFTNSYMDRFGLDPFTVNIPANVTKAGLKPLFVELYSILEENYRTLEKAQYLNTKKLVKNYWDSREEIDLRMKSVINTMDKEWLGGWGSLLTGRLVDQDLQQKVVKVVDEAIADWGFIKLTNKQKVLLYNLIETSPNMTSQQTKSCIRRILTENGNIEDIRHVLEPCPRCTKEFRLVNEVCLKCLSSCFEKLHHFSLVDGIRAFSQVVTRVRDGDDFAALKKAERHPVILIVDEILDTFPWETLPVLNHHPVSRIENVHFLYYLYKLHEGDIVDGYFATKGHEGRYVINPEKNLDRMEKRMAAFVQYWCPEWAGYIAEAPSPDVFIDYLSKADIFLYCGHGDGCQFAADGCGAGVESARGAGAGAVCVLAGCGSARLTHSAGRAPPHAAHRRLHVAGCPAVIGMLWEVTDLEVDKVVSSLLALCIPSEARPPWHLVGKDNWSQGLLDSKVESSKSQPLESKRHPVESRSQPVESKSQPVELKTQPVESAREPDLLRAIVRSRGSSNYAMIGSSVVARGLPVKIR